MSRRRNPPASNMLPLLIAGAGVALLIASRNKAAAPVSGYSMWGVNPPASNFGPDSMAGMGTLGFSLKKSFKKVTHSIENVGKKVVKTTVLKPIQKVQDTLVKLPGGQVLKKLDPLYKPVQKVMKGTRAPAPAVQPGQTIEYQDENGNVITQAEYERRQALYEAQSACEAQRGSWTGSKCMSVTEQPQKPPVSDTFAPSTNAEGCPTGQSRFGNASGTCMTYDQWIAAQPQAAAPAPSAPSSSGGGGAGPSASDYYGGGAADSSAMPPADATMMPSSADGAAPPAPTKMNPLVAVAAFAAVPLVLGLTGGK